MMFDFAGMIAAQNQAAQANKMLELGQQQLAWPKEQYEKDRAITEPLIKALTESTTQSLAFAKEQKDFYDKVYKPLEEKFAETAADWASPERKEKEAARAQATVAQQFDIQRSNAEAQLKDFGINPNSGKYMSTLMQSRVAQGATAAGAAETARYQTEMTGLGLQQQAIATGRGYPAAINQTTATGQGGAQAGIQGQLAQTASGAATMGTGPQYYGLGNQALGMWGNQAQQMFNTQYQGYMQEQSKPSTLGMIAGLFGGAAATAAGAYAGRKFAHGGVVDHYADGGDVTPGGAVPVGASPTRGQVEDDVPAQLTAGEFVLPKDVVSWIGEERAHQIIDKARKARDQLTSQTGAVPSSGPAPDQQPSFVSRPQAALPVG
jgi:hypothetical protein